MTPDDSPIRRRTDDERAAYMQGFRAGADAVLRMIETAYGAEHAARIGPDVAALLDLMDA